MMRARLWPLLAICLCMAACGSPLPGAAPSAERLAQAVLDAVAARDEAALRRLALDEQEFRQHVWPDLPASRPERNLSFSYVWGDLRTKSNTGLETVLREYGGRRFELERIRFTGATTQYQTSMVHRESRLDVRGPEGTPETIQLFGAVIERAGGFKVFSYVVD